MLIQKQTLPQMMYQKQYNIGLSKHTELDFGVKVIMEINGVDHNQNG